MLQKGASRYIVQEIAFNKRHPPSYNLGKYSAREYRHIRRISACGRHLCTLAALQITPFCWWLLIALIQFSFQYCALLVLQASF